MKNQYKKDQENESTNYFHGYNSIIDKAETTKEIHYIIFLNSYLTCKLFWQKVNFVFIENQAPNI